LAKVHADNSSSESVIKFKTNLDILY
jgi:hypothetical protein